MEKIIVINDGIETRVIVKNKFEKLMDETYTTHSRLVNHDTFVIDRMTIAELCGISTKALSEFDLISNKKARDEEGKWVLELAIFESESEIFTKAKHKKQASDIIYKLQRLMVQAAHEQNRCVIDALKEAIDKIENEMLN